MINQTALHPQMPRDGWLVPQATAMSVKQAAAIKKIKPSSIVFTYITGYMAQSSFEGGALFRTTPYEDLWLRDSLGVALDANWSAAHPTNCHCYGYAQNAPGPLWDFRKQKGREFFMNHMVMPMISSPHVDGIFL